jgi:septum site-determining protein MinD
MYFADRAVVVVNPEVSSVRDSDRILGLLSSKTKHAENGNGKVREHLLLTRYSPKRVATGEMMSVGDVKEILGLDVVGVVPESPDVLAASNAGTPVILNENSDVSQAYEDAVSRLLGETVPLRFVDEPKKGFFARMFGG